MRTKGVTSRVTGHEIIPHSFNKAEARTDCFVYRRRTEGNLNNYLQVLVELSKYVSGTINFYRTELCRMKASGNTVA